MFRNLSRDELWGIALAGAVVVVTAIGLLIVPAIGEAWRSTVSLILGILFAGGIALLVGVLIIFYRRQSLPGGWPPEFLGHDHTNWEEGIMKKGRTLRNAALRVQSIQAIVDTLAMKIPDDERNAALYEAGEKMGGSWARDFIHEALTTGRVVGDHSDNSIRSGMLLGLWAEYDAHAGMGRLSFSLDDNLEGTVQLKNGYLSVGDSQSVTDWLIAGYIKGSLKGLFNRELSVRPASERTDAHKLATFLVAPRS